MLVAQFLSSLILIQHHQFNLLNNDNIIKQMKIATLLLCLVFSAVTGQVSDNCALRDRETCLRCSEGFSLSFGTCLEQRPQDREINALPVFSEEEPYKRNLNTQSEEIISFIEEARIGVNETDQDQIKVTPTATGFFAVWRNSLSVSYHPIRGLSLGKDRKPIGKSFIIANTSTSAYQLSLISLSNGNIAVSWTEQSYFTLYPYLTIFKFDESGNATLIYSSLVSSSARYVKIFPLKDKFLMTYIQTNNAVGLTGNLIRNNGSVISARILFDKKLIANFAIDEIYRAAVLSNDNLLVSYNPGYYSPSEILRKCQIFNSTGYLIVPEFSCATKSQYSDSYSSEKMTIFKDSFAISWYSYKQDTVTKGYAYYLNWNVFYNNGSLSGSQVLLNLTGYSFQTYRVLNLNNTHVLLTWIVTVWSMPDYYNNIYAKIVNLKGETIGNQLLLRGGAPKDPFIWHFDVKYTSNQSGQFLITWSYMDSSTFLIRLVSKFYVNNVFESIYPPIPPPEKIPISTLELYSLCEDSYYDGQTKNLTNGWTTFLSSNSKQSLDYFKNHQIEIASYFGRAFLKNNTIVIASRGTWQIYDVVVDGKLYFQDKMVQFQAARAFVNLVMQNAMDQQIRIAEYVLTGHSLGGGVAEIVSAYFQFRAVTFDSPGTKKIIKAGSYLSYTLNVDYATANIVCYMTAPNLVNTMGQHIGKYYRLYPDYKSSSGKLYQEFNQPDKIYYGIYTAAQHTSPSFFESLSSGEPHLKGAIKSWPSGTLIGFNGYDHYSSFTTNAYYWQKYLKNRYKINQAIFLFEHILNFLASKVYLDSVILLVDIFNKIATTEPKQGVEIFGDDSNQAIWGTTHYDDIVHSGKGNNQIYLYSGNDQVNDQAGYDIYRLSLGIKGKKMIFDLDGKGLLVMEETNIQGDIYLVQQFSQPKSSFFSQYNVYLKSLGSMGAYFFIQTDSELYMTPQLENSLSEITHFVRLPYYKNGDFNLTKYSNSDIVVLVGSNSNDILDCSVYLTAKKCIAAGMKGDDTLITREDQQNVELIGHSEGKKKYKIKKSSSNRILQSVLGQNQVGINIQGFKQGDILEMENMADFNLGVQDESTATVTLSNGNKIKTRSSLGRDFVKMQANENGTIVASSLNMSEVLQNDGKNDTRVDPVAPTPSTEQGSSSSTGIIVAVFIVIVCVAGGVGIYCYLKKKKMEHHTIEKAQEKVQNHHHITNEHSQKEYHCESTEAIKDAEHLPVQHA